MNYILIVCIWAIVNSAILFGNQVYYCCDNLLINIPAKVFLAENLKLGRIPLWNPYIFSGMPFLADINLGVLYPGNLLFLFFEPFRALSLLVTVHILWASLGMYLAARWAGITKISSVASAVIFMLSGTFVVYTGNSAILFSASWSSWIVAFTLAYIFTQKKNYYFLLIIAMVFQILAGHPQLTFYTWLFQLSLLLYYSQKIKDIAVIYTPVLLICGVQLLPFAELAILSTRTGRGWDYATFGSLHPLSLLKFVLPALSGSQTEGTVWFDSASPYGFVGIIPLILVLSGWRKSKFIALAGIVSVLLALGKYSPLYWLVYHLVPGIGLFRVPTHFLFITTICVSLLAGYGLDNFRINKKIVASLGILYLVILTASNVSSEIILSVTGPLYRRLLPLVTDGTFTLLLHSIGDNAILYAIFLIIILLTRKKTIIVMLIVIDLLIFAQGSRDLISNIEAQTLIHQSVWQTTTMRPNLNMFYGIRIPDGYGSLIWRPYHDYWDKTYNDPTGVRIVPEKLKITPRIYGITAYQKSVPVRILTDRSDELEVSVNMDASGLLVVYDSNYPGWNATVDGKHTEILPFDVVYRSIQVPSGVHTVRMEYQPISVRIGGIISVFGLLLFTIMYEKKQ